MQFTSATSIVQPLYNAMFGSIGMGHVVLEMCYKGSILQKNFREMTITWSFSYNSFVQLHSLKKWRTRMTVLNTNLCYNEMCYKSTALYLVVLQ